MRDFAIRRLRPAPRWARLLVLSLAAWAAACDRSPPPQAGSSSSVPPRPQLSAAAAARTAALFQQHCASCHGARAEGAPQWTRKGPDGKWPPPPLNGTGHAWHHPRQQLHEMIRDGTGAQGGNMPAWGKTLSREQIDDLITWFQALWPDDIYAAWYENFGGS